MSCYEVLGWSCVIKDISQCSAQLCIELRLKSAAMCNGMLLNRDVICKDFCLLFDLRVVGFRVKFILQGGAKELLIKLELMCQHAILLLKDVKSLA